MVTAREIMSTNVITVARDEDIHEAIRLMVKNNVTGLPVVNPDGTIAGVITEKDVLDLLYEIRDRPGKAEDYMTQNVVCFNSDANVADIAANFRNNHFRRVPILENGRLVGIVSRKDVIRYIRDHLREKEAVGSSLTESVFY
jgi:CBS domain-containing protein